MDLGSAPPLQFSRCPPAFRQLRPTLVSPLLRPSRRAVAPLRLTIPPLPPKPVRPTLGLRLRAVLLAATGFGPPDRGAQQL
jgi:hypothetical protein